jgi:hypothetical protein
MAETLIQNGLIKNKEQYLMVMQTGTLEPEIEGLQAELLLIKQENESLSQGMPVQAIKTENHPLHIMEHKAVLCNLDAKNNPQVLQATLGHIAQHEQLMIQLQLQEPMILQILGIPPVPMAMPPGPATPETETPTKKAADIQKPDLPSLPAGSPPQSQVAYEQMQGAQSPASSIALPAHGFVTGLKVALSGTNLPTGLSATNYWVIVLDADTISLADSLVHAVAGTKISITGAGTTADAALTPASLGSSTVTVKASLDGVSYFAYATPKTVTITTTGNQFLDCGQLTVPYIQIQWTAPVTGALTLAVLAWFQNTQVKNNS